MQENDDEVKAKTEFLATFWQPKLTKSTHGEATWTNRDPLEAKFPVAPERVYELLTNGAKFGEVTGQPGKGGGSTGTFLSLFDGWLQGR